MFLFILAIIVNILGIDNNLNSVGVEGQTRFSANEYLNPISYAQAALVLIILCSSYLLQSKRRYLVPYISLIVLGIINIALASSRGPVLALVGCGSFYLFVVARKRFYKVLFIGLEGANTVFAPFEPIKKTFPSLRLSPRSWPERDCPF